MKNSATKKMESNTKNIQEAPETNDESSRRSYPRLDFRAPFLVQNGIRATVSGVDVSQSGIGFHSHHFLKINSKVDLVFHRETFKVEGVVRYCSTSKENGTFRAGVSFFYKVPHLLDVFQMLSKEYGPERAKV